MYITLESDYAVRIVAILCHSEDRLEAKAIAENASVSLRFALKILRELVNAGIVKSYKGSKGGYILNGKPENITLRAVIEAIEGTYYFSRCLSLEFGCNRNMSGKCCFQKAFDDISVTVREKMDSYNFADLLGLPKKELDYELQSR